MSSVKQIFEETIQTDHKIITEEAAKSILKKYGIKVPGFALVKSADEAAQIRKDLSYFGRFGKQGRGYSVRFLRDELRQILGLDKDWSACLIGVGNLGEAIINYPGFAPEGFRVVAAFDSDPQLVGTTVRNIPVMPMAQLDTYINGEDIAIGIVAVPADEAQRVINSLVVAGVKGILNYAPVAPHVPQGVVIRNIDPVLSLQSMTYYLLKVDMEST